MLEMMDSEQLKRSIQTWLDEDIGHGDMTTMWTIPEQHQSKGIIHVKESGVLAGLSVARLVFAMIDASLQFQVLHQDGDNVEKGTIIATVEGRSRSILLGERLSLNLLQRMSGIATNTQAFVDAVAGTEARIVDTRKTTPGHRMLEKYAVRVGGGYNHRFGLYDAVMIKDNHIKAAGSITKAVQAARQGIPHTMKIEVEVEQQLQWEEAITAGADIIMLDNMRPDKMVTALNRIRQAAPHIVVEASGGVNMESVRQIAETGVDVISIGSITSHVHTLDISLDLHERKEPVR